MGYKFQFVTLAGFHALNMSTFELARRYATAGCSHTPICRSASSRRSGQAATARSSIRSLSAPVYFDDVASVISGGLASTIAMRGSTEEEQFEERRVRSA